jgi:hypothetical protein
MKTYIQSQLKAGAIPVSQTLDQVQLNRKELKMAGSLKGSEPKKKAKKKAAPKKAAKKKAGKKK